MNVVSVKFYKREFTVAVLTIYANIRLIPITVLYFNQRGGMREKHKSVYSVRFLQEKISRSKRKKKIFKKITDVTKNACRIPKLQIGLTQLIDGAEERQ